MLLAAGVSAAAGVYGADQAADAQSDSAKKNAALAQQNLLMQMGMLEPTRQVGYGALSDLGSLYDYNLTPYQTIGQLMNPNSAGGIGTGPIAVNGRSGGSYGINPGEPLGLNDPISSALGIGGSRQSIYGGSINPLTGTVDVTNVKKPKKEAKIEAALTEYLRTGNDQGLGKRMNRFVKEIDRLQGSGYQYDPAAAEAAKNYSPVTPQVGKEGAGTSSGGTAGNMSRFFTSPDYQFNLDQQLSAADRGAAARGGVLSGNALRGTTEIAAGQASREYGNYVNRLLAMAGLGQTATGQAGNAVGNYGAGMAPVNQQQGDARASGIMGSANTWMNGGNTLMNYLALQRGGWFDRPTSPSPGGGGGGGGSYGGGR
jgi:hypothetical protein